MSDRSRRRPRSASRAWIVVAPVVAATITGCPDNVCLLKVCTNGRCRCSISSCPDGAGYDTRQSRCRCLKGYFPVAGQCLTEQAAAEYCGRGFVFDARSMTCARASCRPGDEIDQSTGWCVPHEQVAEVGRAIGVHVGRGQRLGCPAGAKLVVDGSMAACVPLSETCARDETWTGSACVKVAQCPTGAIWDERRRQCVHYAHGGRSELSVNVGEWVTSSYGPNGGTGTTAFCSQFSKKPWSFGVAEGQTAVVQVHVMLSFPDQEVARGVAQTTSAFAASGNPVPATGAAETDSAARAIFVPLQLGGGRATAPTASTMVKCSITNGTKPLSVPETGGV